MKQGGTRATWRANRPTDITQGLFSIWCQTNILPIILNLMSDYRDYLNWQFYPPQELNLLLLLSRGRKIFWSRRSIVEEGSPSEGKKQRFPWLTFDREIICHLGEKANSAFNPIPAETQYVPRNLAEDAVGLSAPLASLNPPPVWTSTQPRDNNNGVTGGKLPIMKWQNDNNNLVNNLMII